jgi:polysaccharide pyruvyl transferase WcaK-like protein
VPRPVTILCANLKGNLGDYAILEVMGQRLVHRHPGIEVRFFHHANKPVDPERYPVFLDECSVPLTDMGAAPYYTRPGWFRLASRVPGTDGLASRIHNRLIDRVSRKLCHEQAFVEALSDSSLVLFAGGSQWGKANLNLNMFAQLACAQRLTRVATFPFGISQAAFDCNGPATLAAMLSRMTPPIPVRDVISHRLLAAAGLDTVPVADCVFTAGDLVSDRSRPGAPRSRVVYVAVTRSGATTPERLVALFGRLRAAGFEPVLFSSCEVEDRPLADAVQALSDEVFVAPHSWKEAVALFAGAAFVITNRLHCLIFSALAGTAVVPVGNRQKARAYAEDAGLDFAPGEIDAITTEAIVHYAGTLDTERARQVAFRASSAARTAVVIDKVCDLVDGTPRNPG